MKYIIALVGMPGSGKSEAAAYLQKKDIPFIRFGDLTDATIKEMGLPLTPENEQIAREKLRKEFGMDIYAIKANPKIQPLLEIHPVIGLDGLYSWEEYVYLIKRFPQLIILHIFAQPKIRYERLSKRTIRPLTLDQARARDIAEINKLHKAGPIAIADYMIENNSEDLNILYGKLDNLLARLEIK